MSSKSQILKYPKEIFNEGIVLNIYKKEFPGIVREYERVVKYTYLNPLRYKEVVLKKSKIFDKNFNALLKKYSALKKDLETLIKFDIEMHKNYAFNFWLISYAINEGPLAFYYTQEVERLLKKLFSNEEKVLETKAIFLRTDYEVFYHKIIKTSVEMFDFLNRFPAMRRLFKKAKNKKDRRKVWDQIIEILEKKHTTKRFLEKFYKEWQWVFNLEDRTIFYTIMNEAVDNYEEDVKKIRELREVKKTIQKVLRLADEKLGGKEAKKLKRLYLLIKYMLWAKDSVFGKKDLKLLPFWFSLTKEIVRKFEKTYNCEIEEQDSSFLLIPWSLRKYKRLSWR